MPRPATIAPAPTCRFRPSRRRPPSRSIRLSVNTAAARNGTPPERIETQEYDALRHRRGDGAGGQDRAEHRPDTGRPTEGERDSDDVRGNGSPAADIQIQAELPLQPGELHQPHHEGAEQQDNAPPTRFSSWR